MLFNSYIFIFCFLPCVIAGYFVLGKYSTRNAQKVWLVCGSLFFYSWWNPKYILLIVSSILINYFISRLMIKYTFSHKSRKKIFIAGIVFNVGLLAFYKYMDFFIDNLNATLRSHIPLLHIFLPLAISFFTLQQIAYLVDVYEGIVEEQNIVNYFLFVSFFPQLIAGPIVHHKEMMPQFQNDKIGKINFETLYRGSVLFFIGFCKKVVVADTFAIWANKGFDQQTILTFLEAWQASLSYSIQLYFDFSGYTDMALGLGLMFHIVLPKNFNSPFKATSIIEFWKRWHITLTQFITTYIYTPIIKSFTNITFQNAMIATFVTMCIAGIWHGANWTFLVFGMIHGFGLMINHSWKKLKLKKKLPDIVSWLITFNWVNLSFIVFRAKNFDDVWKILKGMSGANGFVHINLVNIVFLTVVFGVVLTLQNSLQIMQKKRLDNPFWVGSIAFLSAVVLEIRNSSEFIYFQF